MPLSTFDGEPTTQVHEHHDADGNLTGTTVVTVPGWTDEDRAWALGLALREANQCPRGHDLAEALSDEWKWVPDLPLVCNACEALGASVKRAEKDPRHAAMLHRLTKVPRPKRSKPKRR